MEELGPIKLDVQLSWDRIKRGPLYKVHWQKKEFGFAGMVNVMQQNYQEYVTVCASYINGYNSSFLAITTVL